MVRIQVAQPLHILLSKIKPDKVWAGKSLGYYLLCVSLCQLGYQLWVRISGSVDQGWSRIGFRMIFRLFLDLFWDDHILRAAYYLSVLWLLGLAIVMIRKRLPLKTYIAGEILLGVPSAFFFRRPYSDLFPLLHQLVFFGVFLFETAIPVVWAVILLWLRRKSQGIQHPVIPIARTRALGYYLLCVSLYQVVVLFAFYVFRERFFNLAMMLQARLGLYLFSQMMDEALNLELPDYFEPAIWLAIWLVGLMLAVLMICGRQPLKTYIFTEVFLGIPGAVFVAMCFLSWQLANDSRLWGRLVGTAVFLLVTALPICWACWLLWLKRSIVRAKFGRPVSTTGTSLNEV
jgi:hypothetical protein